MRKLGSVLLMAAAFALSGWPPLPISDVRAEDSAQDALLTITAESKSWLRLLHLERRYLGAGFKSRADADGFFVAPGQGRDPKAELQAELALFQSGAVHVSHALSGPLRCFFPARFEYLRSSGLLPESVPTPDCPAYNAWRARFKPKHLTMVYASAFMGNPASAFGHTFLRIDSESPVPDAERSRLLDTGLSYGADSGGEGGPAFLIKGLLGGYYGRWSMLPYYEKMLEYNDVEARDLWEYRLSLTAAEIDFFLAHLWEVTGGDFDYFFLDENCSHLNLAILEVVKPEWDLLSKFPLTVIPIDTVRAVAEIPGAVTGVRHSPNLKQELAGRLSVLEAGELERLARWREGGTFDLDGAESAPLLDAWITERKLRTIREKKAELSPSESELRHRVLVARAKAPVDRRSISVATQTPPDQGHRNGKIWSGLDFGTGGQAGWVLGHRFAYHDLLDGDSGHLPYSEIEVLGVEVAYHWATATRDPRFRFNRLRLLRSTSLNPVDLTGSPWSWHLSIGGERLPIWDGRTPMTLDLQFALGKSAYLGIQSRRAIVFAMARLGLQGNGVFRAGFRGGPGIWVGIVSSPIARLKWLVDLEALWNPWQPIAQGGRTVWRLGVGVGASVARDWDLRGESKIEAGFRRAADFGWQSTVKLARYY